MHHSENWVKVCLLQILLAYLFLIKWNKDFGELWQIIFKKEYLGKLNIMKLICLEFSVWRFLYSSLKSQESEDQWAENRIEV